MWLSEFVAFLDLELVVFTLAKVDIVKNCHLQLWGFFAIENIHTNSNVYLLVVKKIITIKKTTSMYFLHIPSKLALQKAMR